MISLIAFTELTKNNASSDINVSFSTITGNLLSEALYSLIMLTAAWKGLLVLCLIGLILDVHVQSIL